MTVIEQRALAKVLINRTHVNATRLLGLVASPEDVTTQIWFIGEINRRFADSFDLIYSPNAIGDPVPLDKEFLIDSIANTLREHGAESIDRKSSYGLQASVQIGDWMVSTAVNAEEGPVSQLEYRHRLTRLDDVSHVPYQYAADEAPDVLFWLGIGRIQWDVPFNLFVDETVASFFNVYEDFISAVPSLLDSLDI
jgi:hypothetical protein